MNKYRVGDVVKIVSSWPPDRIAWENPGGDMDCYLGTEMTITEAASSGIYRMREDNCRWAWNEHAIEGLASEVCIEIKLSFDEVFC